MRGRAKTKTKEYKRIETGPKTITIWANQKLWFTGQVHKLWKIRQVAFKEMVRICEQQGITCLRLSKRQKDNT